jgi:hypothetical protein
MGLTRKRISVNTYYNNIVIPTVILIACLGVTIPFLVYEEQRLTSTQLMNSIRNVLSPSNGNPVLRASAVPDLDVSYLPALIGFVGFIGIIVVFFLKLEISIIADASVVAPLFILLVLIGIVVYTISSYSTLTVTQRYIAIAMIPVFVIIFSVSVYQTNIIYINKDKNLLK